MAVDWKETCIADVCAEIVDCVNRTAPVVDQTTPYKMIRTTNVKNGWIDLSSVKYVDQETYERWTRRQVPQKGDIVLTREAPLGEVGMIRSSDLVFLGQRLVSYRANPAQADNRFLLYAFQGHELQAQIKALGSGATVEHMRVPDAKKLMVTLPPLHIQQRIGDILSVYDDLIENNTRRIAILEEMARRLYEEWFVKFRFPGHNEERPGDDLPPGWMRQTVDDVSAYINRGLAPKYDDDAECRVINQKCIRDQRLSMEPARRQSKAVPPEKRVRFGDVLINSTGVGTLGRVAQVYEPLENVTVDSHVSIVRPDASMDADYFGHSLLRLQPFFEDQGVGSTGQTELSRGRIGEAEFIKPPIDLQKRFGQIVRPMRLSCVRLAAKNANLRAQRDLLLPKLISGEIDVSPVAEPEADAA